MRATASTNRRLRAAILTSSQQLDSDSAAELNNSFDEMPLQLDLNSSVSRKPLLEVNQNSSSCFSQAHLL